MFFYYIDVVSVLIFKIIKKKIYLLDIMILFHQLFLKLNKNIFKHNLLFFHILLLI